MNITIRPYQPSDWQRLCEIHNPARIDELASTAGSEVYNPLEQVYIEDGLFAGAVDVAVVNSVVVGFIAYTPNEITWLYVAPDSYRTGIGRALLEHVVATAVGALSLEVLVGNGHAIALYQSFGFRLQEPAGAAAGGTSVIMERKNNTKLSDDDSPVEKR